MSPDAVDNRRAALVLAASGALLGAAHALRPVRMLGDSPLSEDGFYALAVARHVATGGEWSVDGVHPSNGFQPLWVALNVPLYALTHGNRVTSLRLCLLLATLVWCGFGWAMARWTASRVPLSIAPRASALAWALTLGSYAEFRLFHNGLETGLVLLLLAVCVRRLDDPERRTSLTTALALAGLVYARLDAALFVAVAGVASVVHALRSGRSVRASARGALPSVFAMAALVPWLLRNIVLDGHIVPTSGRAESLHVDLARNTIASLAALGQCALAPLVRLPLWSVVGKDVGCLAGAALLVVTARALRPLEHCEKSGFALGTLALGVHVVGLCGYYTLAFGAPHFQDRYLAAVLLLTVPASAAWLACAAPALRRAVLCVIAAVNAGLFVCSLAGFGTLGGTTFHDQTAWVIERVVPTCVVGAGQSGALGYFRDRVINLDGKVNSAALTAIHARALRGYVDTANIDVVIDWSCYVHTILGVAPVGFVRAGAAGAFEAWVRVGREACVYPLDD